MPPLRSGYENSSLLEAEAGAEQVPLPSLECDGHCDLALLEIYGTMCERGDGVCERARALAAALRPLSRQLLGAPLFSNTCPLCLNM